MERKEKITFVKNKMLFINAKSKQIKQDYSAIESLRLSLMGSGIDYSKDRVQTTPENNFEKVLAKMDELERRIVCNKAIVEKAMKRLTILDDKEKIVLLNIYFRDMSINETSRRMHLSKRSVCYIRNDALENYYNNYYQKTV